MNIQKKIIKEMRFPYAVKAYDIGGRKKIVCATELEGPCVGVWADTLEQELIWDGFGGTMNTWQLNENGDFLAIQNFFKGFNSKAACLVWMYRTEGKWKSVEVARIPYLHRFCVVDTADGRYVVCCQLTRDKENREDWSQPGRVLVGKLPDRPGPIDKFITVLDGLYQNHGLFTGSFFSKDCIMVTSRNGLYCCFPPQSGIDSWRWELLIDRPISDCMTLDIDGDGQDEIITIEPFHGNDIVVYRLCGIEWKEVYKFPCAFGHALWAGKVFGKPAWFIGYRQANSALLMFSLREIGPEGDWFVDITTIDEHEAPTNIEVLNDPDRVRIFCSSGGKDRLTLYELTP